LYTVAKVAVENTAGSFDVLYTYLIPEKMNVLEGCRVRIPFGRWNHKRTGLVMESLSVSEREGLKPVSEVLDISPVLDREGLAILKYLKEHTFCTHFEALRLIIPAGLSVVSRMKYSIAYEQPELIQTLSLEGQELIAYLLARREGVEGKKICKDLGLSFPSPLLDGLAKQGLITAREIHQNAMGDKRITMLRLLEVGRPVPLTPKQKSVVEFLCENGDASIAEVLYNSASTKAVTDGLVKKGLVEYYDLPSIRNSYGECQSLSPSPIELTIPQSKAYENILALLSKNPPSPALLHGVTGSGKTQVFISLIQEVLNRGRNVIVLVPEISLTAQIAREFLSRFGEDVSVLHSALSLGERMDQWRRLKAGKSRIAIGTRSAIFAPLSNIGLIVVDEEQEHTYKSEKAPRYHARDIARLRSQHHKSLLLLSSATPSIETYWRATNGQYSLVTLSGRFNQAPLPQVMTIDMRDPQNHSSYPTLSAALLDEIRYNLDHGEQSILLLNRRGYSTLVKCAGCAGAAYCPHCSVSLTYHSANDHLLCHYCGYIEEKPKVCASCGASLIRYAGSGTQKIAEILSEFYPEARVLRVDLDTTMKKFAHEEHFSAFSEGKYDIMVGTQMVAKGLNFPNVTLVGVLSADQSLYSGDFRSFERTFSLLTQVIGRSGRGKSHGRAIVQTYSPDNPLIQLAAHQDYPAFYREEIISRRLHLYPPFCTMAGIGFSGVDRDETLDCAIMFMDRFKKVAADSYPGLPARLLGPVPGDIAKTADRYRYKLILKCKNDNKTRSLIREMLGFAQKKFKHVHVFADMYYDRF